MSAPMTDKQTGAAFSRAVSWIYDQFGPIGDLPASVVPVVWVTVYGAMEIGLDAEEKGGATDLTKDIIQGGNLLMRVETSLHALDFLRNMIPTIRSASSDRERKSDSQLLIDMLKWNMLDAPTMSRWGRMRARQSAKADPMYQQAIPPAILTGRR